MMSLLANMEEMPKKFWFQETTMQPYLLMILVRVWIGCIVLEMWQWISWFVKIWFWNYTNCVRCTHVCRYKALEKEETTILTKSCLKHFLPDMMSANRRFPFKVESHLSERRRKNLPGLRHAPPPPSPANMPCPNIQTKIVKMTHGSALSL